MAMLKGKGTPTRKTVGAVGDIYTDTATGKQYKCTFAYRSDNDEEFDCQWKELKVGGTPEAGKELKVGGNPGAGKVEEKVEEVVEEQEPVQEEEKVDEEAVEESKPESVEVKEEEKPKRTNYAAYNKKSK